MERVKACGKPLNEIKPILNMNQMGQVVKIKHDLYISNTTYVQPDENSLG